MGLDESSVYLHAAPMFHLGDVTALLGACRPRGRMSFIPHFEPRRVLETIEKHRVTYTLLVPTMIHMLLEQLESCSRRYFQPAVDHVRRLAHARGGY